MAAVSSCCDGKTELVFSQLKCPVKSGNEQDLYLQLQSYPPGCEHNVETARVNGRKVQATIGHYASNLLGYTRITMVRTMGCNSEKRS